MNTDRAPTAMDFSRNVHCLFGLPVDAVDRRDTLDIMRASVTNRRQLWISTPNVNFLATSRKDPAFRETIVRSDLVVLDGMPLVWLARALGFPARERVAGSDLFDDLRKGRGGELTVYFFGGPDGAAEKGCDVINSEPGPLRCVGWQSPGFGTVEELSAAHYIAAIRAAQADFLVVSLPARKGQLWIDRHRDELGAHAVASLGAVLNFVAGTVVRAPSRMRRFGLEWLWRIREEPTLWRRYFDDGRTVLGLVARHLAPLLLTRIPSRAARADHPARLDVRQGGGATTISPSGIWVESDLAPMREAFAQVTREAGSIVVDLGGLRWLDSSVLGVLMLLYGHQSRRGLPLSFIGASRPLRRLIARHGADYLLEGLEDLPPTLVPAREPA